MFQRLHLLVIVFPLISYFNNVYGQDVIYPNSIGIKDTYTGTYKLASGHKTDQGYIEVLQITPHTIKFYINVIRFGSIAETHGYLEINDKGEGVFPNQVYGARHCILTVFFKNDTLYLHQDGQNWECAFGIYANVNGIYKKNSSKKPLFKEWENEIAVAEEGKEQAKQIQQRFDSIISNYKRHPPQLERTLGATGTLSQRTMDIYNKFLNSSFRDSLRLAETARQLWYYSKETSPGTRLRHIQSLLQNADFHFFDRHWIALTPTDSGEIIFYQKNKVNPCIEIMDDVITVNGADITQARFIKTFQRISSGEYMLTSYKAGSNGSDTCIFKTLNTQSRLTQVTYINSIEHRKVFHWTMVPIENMIQYPLSLSPIDTR